jgi:hypothetical protein
VSRRRIDKNDKQALIQHHLEEASTHIGMVRQLAPKHSTDLGKIGAYLNKLYVKHGGQSH